MEHILQFQPARNILQHRNSRHEHICKYTIISCFTVNYTLSCLKSVSLSFFLTTNIYIKLWLWPSAKLSYSLTPTTHLILSDLISSEQCVNRDNQVLLTDSLIQPQLLSDVRKLAKVKWLWENAKYTCTSISLIDTEFSSLFKILMASLEPQTH